MTGEQSSNDPNKNFTIGQVPQAHLLRIESVESHLHCTTTVNFDRLERWAIKFRQAEWTSPWSRCRGRSIDFQNWLRTNQPWWRHKLRSSCPPREIIAISQLAADQKHHVASVLAGHCNCPNNTWWNFTSPVGISTRNCYPITIHAAPERKRSAENCFALAPRARGPRVHSIYKKGRLSILRVEQLVVKATPESGVLMQWRKSSRNR